MDAFKMKEKLNDKNFISIRGVVQGIHVYFGYRTVQIATNAGGIHAFTGQSATPIVYVFDTLSCPNFEINSHIEIEGHLQPFHSDDIFHPYKDIIAVDRLELVGRDIAYEFRIIPKIYKKQFSVYDGAYPDDLNKSLFIGTIVGKKIGKGKNDVPRVSIRLRMVTPDMTAPQDDNKTVDFTCSIICYGKQAEAVQQARQNARVAITARTDTMRTADKHIKQQQVCNDIFVFPNK